MAQKQNNNSRGIQECDNANREFRKIPSLNFLYEINDNGTIIRNVKSKRQLKIKLDYHHSKKGYYVTFVHIGGRGPHQRIKRVMIHRAVAECWLGACPEGYQVDHIDRNPHNNYWSNLRYVTHSEQMQNRDHSNISKTGSANLQNARKLRSKPVRAEKDHTSFHFESMSEASRELARMTGAESEKIRYRLRQRRKYILGYTIHYE